MHEIIPIERTEIIDPNDAPASFRRRIAELLGAHGESQVYVEHRATKMPYVEYLAVILWELIAEGKSAFADGTVLKIDTIDEWLPIVKYVATHLDGPARAIEGPTANFFKVYIGVDTDKI